jgi:thiamine-phosphate pyrophosphorylase
MSPGAPRLLWVTDRARAGRPLVELALALEGAGVEALVVREPDLTDSALLELARALVSALEGRAMRVLVNDRLDVALAAGAHGVHLKSNGMDPRTARAVAEARLGAGASRFLIGRSCHAGREVAEAARAGADHVTLSPLAASPGKRPLGWEGFARELDDARRRLRGPIGPCWLALGGLQPEHCPSLASLTRPGERWGAAAIRALQGADAEEIARRFRRHLSSGG